ncbi:MAG: hypothetical protein ACI92E_003327, partial [Oceanicoccus sp.]
VRALPIFCRPELTLYRPAARVHRGKRVQFAAVHFLFTNGLIYEGVIFGGFNRHVAIEVLIEGN